MVAEVTPLLPRIDVEGSSYDVAGPGEDVPQHREKEEVRV